MTKTNGIKNENGRKQKEGRKRRMEGKKKRQETVKEKEERWVMMWLKSEIQETTKEIG